VAVVVTVAKGYDLGYVWKNQGHKEHLPEKSVGGYYLNAAQHGEPPGRKNARWSRLAGVQRAEVYWAGREQRFQEVLHSANRAPLEYLQAWAGVTRSGYHGVRVDGQEPGRSDLRPERDSNARPTA
jgi:hypothetical protein